MKKNYLLLLLIFISGSIFAQTPNGFLDFGTTATGTTATLANSGINTRIGSGGGTITFQNPGQTIGTDAELRGIAPTAGSINSLGISSTEFGTAATTFTVSFELHLSGGASGTWYFFAGNGGTFGSAQSSTFTGADVFTGIRWVFGAAGAITTNNRNAGAWNATGIAGTPFAQSTAYYVTIVGNNSASTVNYGVSQSVAANTYDLWVNGVLVGDDLAKALLANAANINAFRFYGESSTGNVAQLAVDNIRWYNSAVLPATHLAFNGVPGTGTVGTNLASFTAEAHCGSATGPLANLFTNTVTLSKASGPGNISGTLTPAAVAGVATYSDIQFDAAGTYTMDATAPSPVVKATSGNVVIAAASGPFVTVISSLTQFNSVTGVPSAEQSYTVEGANLTADIVLTPPVGFEISLTGGGVGFVANPGTITLAQSGGAVAITTVYVRMNSTTLGVNTGNISHASAGSNNPNVALTGKVIATEPTVQSAITFGAITNNTMVVNFSGGNGAKRILLVKAILPVNSDPVDGTTYSASATYGAGDQLGTGNYVVYAGTGNTVTVTGLSIGTLYQYAVYEYNDGNVTGAENYLVPGGVNNAVTTSIPVIYTWIGGSSTWNTAANWLPARLFPSANDILLFLDGTTETVTAVPSESIGQLHVTLGTHVTLQAAAATTTLTLNGSILLDDLTVDATSALNISGANGYTINLATGTTGAIDGTMTFTGGIHKLTAADASAVTFKSGSVFTAGAGFTGNAFGTVNINSIIFANGSRYDYTSGSNPFGAAQPASVVTFQTGSLFRVLTNLVAAFSGRTYANFELDNAAYSTPSTGTGPLSIDNLTITNGSLNLNLTGGISIKGNISVATGQTLTFTPASLNTLTFNGTTAQSITATAATLTFGNNEAVTFNNAAGITINSGFTLNNLVTFTSGIVSLPNPVAILTLGATASVAGASNASFVDGFVSKIGNTAFTFPVGKTNCGPSGTIKGFLPLSISAPSIVTDQFTAQYFRGSAAALGPVTNPGINHVSGCDYWILNRDQGGATVDITLSWDETLNNCTTATPYINDLASLIIAHFDGTNWSNFGGLGMYTGTAAAGTITWTGVNTFSPFSIASSTFSNPLPVVINYLNGTKNGSNHLLNWKAICVSVPSVNIELQRSGDGSNYSSIYSIFATALRCQQPFDYTDNQPLKGINYYRLKITDADGKVTYSTVVPLINAVKGIDVINIAPNPVVNSSFNLQISSAEKTPIELVITDMQGRVVLKQLVNLIAGFNSIPMNIKNLAAGTYQLFGNTTDERTRVLRFVIQSGY